MTWRQALAAVVLLLLTTGLVGALTVFQARAQALAAEGRDLLSPGAVAVRVTTAELLRRGPDFPSGTRAFRDVADVPRARVAVVLHGNWSDVPRSSGIRFLSDARGQALVGDALSTDAGHGALRVDVGGTLYDVHGQLGSGSDSLLAQDILVADPSAFAAAEGSRTVLDGPEVGAHAAAAFGADRVETVDGGANRRTTVDFVTPIVLALGFTVATMSSIIAGTTAARHETDRARIRWIVGRNSATVLLRAATVAVVQALVVLCVSAAVLADPSAAVGVTAVGAISIQCAAFVAATVLTVAIRRRSWS